MRSWRRLRRRTKLGCSMLPEECWKHWGMCLLEMRQMIQFWRP